MESLAVWFAETLGQYISGELVVFIISMIPILELRGGLIVAKLLQINLLTAIPLCIAGSLLLSPVFINLSAYNTGCKTLSYFTPVNYYLNSIHSGSGKTQMFFFGLVLLVISIALRIIPVLKQKVRCKSISLYAVTIYARVTITLT